MSDYYKEAPLPLFATRAPSVNGSATSAAAADSLRPAALNAMQRRVYEFICRTPSTDEEITNELEMNASTVRPRRIELARRGLIVEAGTRRTASGRMATIWKATAASR
jgi:transcription initiation factor IIE alpha subunit